MRYTFIDESESLAYEIFVSFATLITITGLLGNFLLVASLSYAHFKGRHGFNDSNWSTSTIFMINVAVVDFGYCLFLLINGAYGIYVQKHSLDSDSSHGICKAIVLCRHNLAVIDGWATAAVSINAAFPKIW